MNSLAIRHSFAKYVSLNVIGMIGLSCYILADTFFVARSLGANGLAALNLAIPLYSFLHGTGLMFGMGGATRFTISKSEQSFTQALYYIAGMACLFVVMGVGFSEPLAQLLGADSDTVSYAATYLKVILCFAPLFLLNNVVLCFVRNDGNPNLSMLAMLLGSLSNILLDYVFLFPCGMGMFGAALATGIAPLISLLVLSLHVLKKRNHFHLLKQAPNLHGLSDMLRLGSSALITECSSGIVMIVFNTLILRLAGNVGVAAYGILANIALVVIAVFTGIAQGMQPLVSLCHREGQHQNVRALLRYGCLTAVSVAVLVYAVSALFAEPIVAVFNKDNHVQLTDIAVQGLRLYFTAFAFVGVNILCAGYFSAIDKPKNAFLISILRGFLVIVPTSWILSLCFGLNGIWLAMTLSEAVVLCVSLHRLRTPS